MITLPSHITVEEYAKLKGLHRDTVRGQCVLGKTVVARKKGRDWETDIAATERLQSLKLETLRKGSRQGSLR